MSRRGPRWHSQVATQQSGGALLKDGRWGPWRSHAAQRSHGPGGVDGRAGYLSFCLSSSISFLARFSSSVARELPITSDMAYFRFHGRNAEMWWKGDSETRYKYLYGPEEIEELSGRVKSAAGKTELLFAFFNNHWQGYAPRNAIEMKGALQLPLKAPAVKPELEQGDGEGD